MLPAKLQAAFSAEIRKMPFFSFPDVAFHSDGYSNAVFKVRSQGKDYAVRFSKSPALKKSVFLQYGYEKAVWGQVASLNVSPRIFQSGKVKIAGKTFPYSIQDFAAGRPLDQSRDMALLAAALRRLHGGTRNAGKGLLDAGDAVKWMRKQLEYYCAKPFSQVPAQVSALVRANIFKAEKSLVGSQSCMNCIAHNDLVGDNVIVSGGRVVFIDWGWAMFSSPAVDVCCALSPFVTSWKKPLFVTGASAKEFVHTYARGLSAKQKHALNSDLLRLWGAYNAMTAAWVLCDYAPHARSISRRRWFASAAFLKRAFSASSRLKSAVVAALV